MIQIGGYGYSWKYLRRKSLRKTFLMGFTAPIVFMVSLMFLLLLQLPEPPSILLRVFVATMTVMTVPLAAAFGGLSIATTRTIRYRALRAFWHDHTAHLRSGGEGI